MNEPLPPDSEADWRVALEMALRRRDNESDRLDRIDSKIAPIIAGTIAALALFVDKASSLLDIAAAALYLIPLALLFFAFKTDTFIDVPDLGVLKESWQPFPKTFIRVAFEGTVEAVAKNAPKLDAKANRLNAAMACVMVVTIIILTLRFAESFSSGVQLIGNVKPTAAIRSASGASATGGVSTRRAHRANRESRD